MAMHCADEAQNFLLRSQPMMAVANWYEASGLNTMNVPMPSL